MANRGGAPRTLRRGSGCPHCALPLFYAADGRTLQCPTGRTYRVGQPVPPKPVAARGVTLTRPWPGEGHFAAAVHVTGAPVHPGPVHHVLPDTAEACWRTNGTAAGLAWRLSALIVRGTECGADGTPTGGGRQQLTYFPDDSAYGQTRLELAPAWALDWLRTLPGPPTLAELPPDPTAVTPPANRPTTS